MCRINIRNLNKRYGKKMILENFNLTLDNKKYNFLIGDNGTGKSTFLKCLTDLTKYQGIIEKKDMIISYCPEKINLPDYITLKNFLVLLGNVNNINYQRLNGLLDYYIKAFGLEDFKNQYIIRLSLGTKQKISIIQALLSDADIYIFDEPLNGLDDNSKRFFMEELRNLKKKGKLILITTHQVTAYPFRMINKIDFNNKEQYCEVMEIA